VTLAGGYSQSGMQKKDLQDMQEKQESGHFRFVLHMQNLWWSCHLHWILGAYSLLYFLT
jgi:hypothetical protein